jgi:hypothetical protein
MKFEDSNPKRLKAAIKAGLVPKPTFERQPIPPAKTYQFLAPSEMTGDKWFVYDAESYANYFCVSFKCLDTGKVITFEDSDYYGYRINNCDVTQELWTQWLSFIIFRYTLIGFNSRSYDMPICLCAAAGVRAPMLCQITEDIITHDMPLYEVERKYGVKTPQVNHIDLIEVTPLQGSLKLYSARLHCERIQDLPYPPLSVLSLQQMYDVRDYNVNDLDNTELLWLDLKDQIELRVALGLEYGVDLRSRSDAQIAETVIGSELEKLGCKAKPPEWPAGTQFYYKVPDFVSFKTAQLQQVLEAVRTAPFTIAANGYAENPIIEKLKARIGNCVYRLGLGGLHSSEECMALEADENTLIIDRDVARYYPSIILNQELYPTHLGPAFLTVYNGIVTKRDMAKVVKDKKTDGSLKIVINGTFGKLGNQYSILYSPDLLMQVTITGQLCLLMLIEAIELAGLPVRSANTDGVVILCPKDRYKDLDTVVMMWENLTGFVTEETRYKGLYCRDVNNYIAVKEDGSCKLKGIYAEVGSALNSPLSKNPEAYICSMAVQAFLSHGTPIRQTIELLGENVETEYYPTPMSRFVCIKNVKGGGEKDGVYLGKVVRWYYAEGERTGINSVISGNQVAKSEGGKPCMIMPDHLPTDIDLDKYVADAEKELYNLGVLKRLATGTLI